MLSRYNPAVIETALCAASPPPPFPPAHERAIWEGVRAELGEARVGETIAQAESDLAEPVPALPATLFLEFARKGERGGYQTPRTRRREMLKTLTLAECLEGRGRFLDGVLDVVWAILEESSWVLPAHQSVLTDLHRPVIDLGVAETVLSLAECDLLLGDALDPLVGKRIRDEAERRCFTPYLTRHDHWWLFARPERGLNNWTAVCSGGVAGAALYLEPDVARLAELVARAARSLDDYLATFDEDGGSSEGPGYWSYGFGAFTMLAQLVEARTEGRVDFLAGDAIPKIARYPLATVLSPGRYVTFSDCDLKVGFTRSHLSFLARRLALPELMPLARVQQPGRREQSLHWALRDLFWQPDPEPVGESIPAPHSWFGGMMWMLARYDPGDADALVLAAKGGHNGEMHNQNDVGSFIVHIAGESVITDPGRGRYTRAYFGPERYEHLVNASTGHSVPVVNTHPQHPGKNHHATLLGHHTDAQRDTLTLELAHAYPDEADLKRLERTLTLHREGPHGWVELVDTVHFERAAGTFESVLITFGEGVVGADTVTLRGERGALTVHYDPAVVTATLETVPQVDLAEGPHDLRRVTFALLTPAHEAVVRLRIEPLR